MSLAMLIALIAVTLVLSVCLGGVFLWLSVKPFKIRPISLPKAIGIWLMVVLVSTLISLTELWVAVDSVWLIFLLAELLIPFVVVYLFLKTNFWRALAVFLMTNAGILIVTLPLVFLLVRATIIEAFVVPTGAMAPTILGHHYEVICPDSGYRFAVDAPIHRQSRGPIQTRSPITGHPIHVPQNVVPKTGDRILVDKISTPQRWDAMVFKAPHAPDINYIMRLVGLPGESVQIAGGEVFVDGKLEAKPFGVAEDLWFFVDDTRYRPQTGAKDVFQWVPADEEQAWRRTATGFAFVPPDDQAHTLVFQGRINDRYPYNPAQPGGDKPRPVGDVRVEFEAVRDSTDAELTVSWTRGQERIEAALLADGTYSLTAGEQSNNGTLLDIHWKKLVVTFAVRDGHVYLAIDGRLLDTMPTGPLELEPYLERTTSDEPCQLAMIAKQGSLTLDWITVYRDVYYTSGSVGRTYARAADQPIILGADEHFVLGDNSPRSMDSRYWQKPAQPWAGRIQPGAVPSELIIGVARWVYWPPERWKTFH